MTILYDAYTALLSGITTKTGNEIHWENEKGNPITVEPIDVDECKYVVRDYYQNSQLYWERNYQNGKLHGKYFEWYKNGQLF